MKCPECEVQGVTSKVYPYGTYVTLMAYQPWYDEDGVYHSHDGNKRTSSYSCSNGHDWVHTYVAPCPAGDFP